MKMSIFPNIFDKSFAKKWSFRENVCFPKKCHILAVLSRVTCQTDLSSLFYPSCPVLDALSCQGCHLSQLSCPNCSVPGALSLQPCRELSSHRYPVFAFMPWRSCPLCPASRLNLLHRPVRTECPGCPVLEVMFQKSYPNYLAMFVPSWFAMFVPSWFSCPSCSVQSCSVLFPVSYTDCFCACPAPPVPTWPGFPVPAALCQLYSASNLVDSSPDAAVQSLLSQPCLSCLGSNAEADLSGRPLQTCFLSCPSGTVPDV
jgi:hypothetical protein